MSPGNFRASQSNTNLVILLKHKILHLVSYKYYSPADNDCNADDEDIEAENTEHNYDKQEGEVYAAK